MQPNFSPQNADDVAGESERIGDYFGNSDMFDMCRDRVKRDLREKPEGRILRRHMSAMAGSSPQLSGGVSALDILNFHLMVAYQQGYCLCPPLVGVCFLSLITAHSLCFSLLLTFCSIHRCSPPQHAPLLAWKNLYYCGFRLPLICIRSPSYESYPSQLVMLSSPSTCFARQEFCSLPLDI